MKSKIKSMLIIVVAINATSYAQSHKQNYFIKANQDTVFCNSIEAYRNGGNVTTFSYTDLSGKANEVTGKKNCEEIKTYVIDGQSYDLIPLKASKPDGYQRHMWRKIDGKVKVYDYQNQIDNGEIGDKYMNVTVVKYVALMPDGKFYDINKKSIENVIKPELLKCSEFANTYTRSYGDKPAEFDSMIKLYNDSCK